MMEIRINHVGYDEDGPKKAVLMAAAGDAPGLRAGVPFRVVAAGSGRVVYTGEAAWRGPVDRWKDWVFWTADFSGLRAGGDGWYRVEVPGAALGRKPGASAPASAPFEIAGGLLLERTAAAVLRYFRGRRCAGIWDAADCCAPFVGGRPDRVDVHGGWYDASGDLSKYLSHLSYANYLNPQQTPFTVWSFLLARDLLARGIPSAAGAAHLGAAHLGVALPSSAGRAPGGAAHLGVALPFTAGRAQGLRPGGGEAPSREAPAAGAGKAAELQAQLLEEALYGAEFLRRMQDPAGYFYMTVFDRWTKDPAQREICSFRNQEGHKSDDYQAGYRQGGGLAIAALARAGGAAAAGERREDYLRAAAAGFHHLEAHNREYLDDGRENIIDDYCALLAAAELYAAAGGKPYLAAARRRAESLVGRLTRDERYAGWWRAGERGERPFFHAAEAGLPAIALLRYREVEPEPARREAAFRAVRTSLEFELRITAEVANPFGYARQYVKPVGGEKRGAFFFPHANESGYWWQGENARIASLAAAARLADRLSTAELGGRLCRYATDQLNWILGLNPFDACLLHGFGRNNPDYEERWPNSCGGVCNGITGGFADEQDIDFLPLPYAEQGEHRWRWSEQWIPHGSWYLLAVCAGA